MRVISCLSIILFITVQSFAQNIEDKFIKKTYTCVDAENNCPVLIPQYYYKGDLDSVRILMNYWQAKCNGGGEKFTRLKILLSIKGDSLSEKFYDYNIIPHLYSYRATNEAKLNNEPLDENNRWISTTESNEVFDSLTVNIATELKQKQDLNVLERFFVNFYSNNYENALAQLKTTPFDSTKLQSIYFQHVNRYKGKPDYNAAFYLGGWFPQSHLSVLGIHPAFGFERGVRFKRFTVDGELNYKFLKTPQTYKVLQNDSVWESRAFNSVYMGIKTGLDI